MLSYVLDSFCKSQLDEVVVVASEAIEAVARSGKKGVRVLVNSDPSGGMSTSLKLALGAVRGRAVVIGMGDQPLLLPSTIDAIVSAYITSNAKVVVPVYRGRRGNPVLFDRTLFPQMMKIQGDVGAKSVIADNPDLVREVVVSDEGILLDIDTPSDLFAARLVLEKRARRTKTRGARPRPRPRQPPAKSSSRGPLRRRSTGRESSSIRSPRPSARPKGLSHHGSTLRRAP